MIINPANRIHEIANQLAKEGIEVTASAIRQAMDDRESYSKIFHVLEEWKRTHVRPPLLLDAPVLEDVETTLKNVMHVIWHAGAIEARAELQRLRADAQHSAADLRRDLADALLEVSSLENDVSFHSRKLEELSVLLQKTEAVLTTRDTEVNVLRQQLNEITQQQRGMVDRIERLATRAGSAEAAVRNKPRLTSHTHEAFDEDEPNPAH